MLLTANDKITKGHLEKHAYVYVRQSSPKQVLHNRESQQNQYALVERAIALGWIPERVHVIDADLGQSGQDGSRIGFQELVAEVSLGHVGIVFAYEASRLARNNADWYALLDLATVVGTLIGDADGIYDPRSYNDRLLLGLRGMLSEAELHLLRLRLDAGRLRQVEQGTYRQRLPTGLMRLADGRVVKDPDLHVQRTLQIVFERFAALGSCQKVLRSLRDDRILLPRAQRAGPDAGQVIWKKPSNDAIYEIVRNPAYAGAFVYGRHGPPPTHRPGRGRDLVNRPMEEWTTIHQNVYPAFIEWEQFMANQERLADNAYRHPAWRRGAPRAGRALLTGLVVCGRCGRQMHTRYKTDGRYVCDALARAFGEPTCLYLDAPTIDAVVVAAFFEAIQPAELAILDEVLDARRADQARRAQQYADQVTRAEYEARLAQRQYMAVDPENRLVASELEHRWELALRALAEAREAAERFARQPSEPPLDPTLRAQLADLGTHLPELWGSGRLTPEHKKELLRSLIRRIILTRPTMDTVEVKVVWVSGAISTLTVHPSILRARDLAGYSQLVERVLALGAEGYPDQEIARRLAAEGFRAPRSKTISKRLVFKIRRAHQQTALINQFRHQPKVEGHWTVFGLSRALNIDRNWLYRRIARGTLPATRHAPTGFYLIEDDPTLLEHLRSQLPKRCVT